MIDDTRYSIDELVDIADEISVLDCEMQDIHNTINSRNKV